MGVNAGRSIPPPVNVLLSAFSVLTINYMVLRNKLCPQGGCTVNLRHLEHRRESCTLA